MIVKAENGPPPPKRREGRPCKYPWKTMAVGQSFVAAGTDHHAALNMTSMAKKKYGREFTAKKTEQGTRIWRTA